MTIKVGDKYKGTYLHNLISIVCVTNEYVVCKYEDNLLFKQDSENAFRIEHFLESYYPYTPPVERWTYVMINTLKGKESLCNVIFPDIKSARAHADKVLSNLGHTPKTRFFQLDNAVFDDTEKEI